MENSRILVLGGSGKTGRRISERLKGMGREVRLASRSTTPSFNWTRPDTWRATLSGIDAVYVSYQPDLAVPGAVAAIKTFCDLAAECGVRHVVLLSGRGEEEAVEAENVVKRSGLDYTIVRASWFFQNFSETFMLDGIRAGELVLPAGGVREPFIDAEDIADVAVAALTGPGHIDKIYEVTGPRLMTFAEAVAEIANASGREIRYTPVSVADYAALLASHEVPGDYIWLLTYLFTSVLDGRNESLTDGVRQALGRPPADFTDFARKTAATSVWAQAE